MNILPCLIYYDCMKASRLPISVKSILRFAVFYEMINDHLSHIQLTAVVLKRKGFVFLTLPVFTQPFYFLKFFRLSRKGDGLASILPLIQALLSIMELEAVSAIQKRSSLLLLNSVRVICGGNWQTYCNLIPSVHQKFTHLQVEEGKPCIIEKSRQVKVL